MICLFPEQHCIHRFFHSFSYCRFQKKARDEKAMGPVASSVVLVSLMFAGLLIMTPLLMLTKIAIDIFSWSHHEDIHSSNLFSTGAEVVNRIFVLVAGTSNIELSSSPKQYLDHPQ